MMSRTSTKTTKKRGPLRIIIRCAWSGSRLTVPPEGLTLKSTLADVTSRLSELPPLSSSATLVCLRKLAIHSEWVNTTLGEMLDGDDGSAGILLTLDLGLGGDAKASSGCKTVIEKTAESLNIKPEPMEISDNSQHQQHSGTNVSLTTPATAWAAVLQSNFDTTSKSCLLTLLKIIDNLLSRPGDIKVRCIRCANVNFQQKLGNCKGGLEFMYSLGFEPNFPAFGSGDPESLELKEKESRDVLLMGREVLILSAKRDFGMDDEELPKMPVTPATVSAPSTGGAATATRPPSQGFDIYKGHSINIQAQQMGAPDPYSNKSLSTTERQLQNLEAKKKNMEKQLQKTVEVDRCLVAYLPGDGPTGISTASSGAVTETKGDSSLVAARMKRMEEERKKREEGGFTTKAMRDLERMKKAKVYSHAQIRINFPDGTHLHGRFLPTENISTIRNIIQSSLLPDCQSDFDLYVAPPRRLLNDTKSLEEEELVPAAKIHVSWKSSVSNNTGVGGFVRRELYNGNINAPAFPEAKPIVPEMRAQPSNTSSTTGNEDGPSKEEVLMARMMGKGSVGAKKSAKSSGGSDQEKKGGKPKWFK